MASFRGGIQIFGNSSIDTLSYNWNGPNGFNSALENPYISDTGMYILTVLDTLGCMNMDTAFVFINDTLPNISASGDTISCAFPNGTLTANSTSPDISYHWIGPNGFDSNEQNPSATIAGTYTAIAIGQNGCMDSTNVELIS